MKRIQLTAFLSDEEADKLAGTKLDDHSYNELITEECELYDGETLIAVYKKNCLPKHLCGQAYNSLRAAAVTSNNRGIAAGKDPQGNKRRNRVSDDGRVSKTTISAYPVNSGLVGFFDRYPRIPYCRQTAYTMEHKEEFLMCLPFIQQIDKVFKETIPHRYFAQHAKAELTSKDFIIPETVFTTITVNKNWQTAVHKDAGDLKEGFGVMTVFKAGTYTGGYFVLPKYRVAFDHGTGDILFCDVHQWHGNTPIVGKPGRYERLSLVLYYREKMTECGTIAQELERAKNKGAL